MEPVSPEPQPAPAASEEPPSGRRRAWLTGALSGAVMGAAAVAGLAFGGDYWLERTNARPQAQLTALAAPAPPPAPARLQEKLDALARSYGEPVGIAVMDVDAGWLAGVDASAAYPQQSVSKLWVALATLDAVDRGERRLDQLVHVDDDDRSVFYQPIAGEIGPDGYTTTLHGMLRRAIVDSDNAANDKLIRDLGGVGEVARALRRKKLAALKVGAEERVLQSQITGLTWRREYGYRGQFKQARAALPDAVRDQAMRRYLAAPPDGASPAAIVRALAALKRGRLLSADSTDVLLTLMTDVTTGPNRLKGGLPQDWSAAHKTGTGQDWRGGSIGINDVGLLDAPDGRTYAVAVMIRRTGQPVPARLHLMQEVARAVSEEWRSAHGAEIAQATAQVAKSAS